MEPPDDFWEQEQGGSESAEALSEGEEGRPSRRRFSLGLLGRKLASAANNLGESIARTAAAAGEVIVDAELRSRSAQMLSDAAKKAGAGMAKGLQQGAGRIAAGPRTVQGILTKLQHRMEEQRLQALLEEQKDTPVDVQVAFQLYEDAPQELRSRLWMAVLEHPELCKEYGTLATQLQHQRQQLAAASDSADGEAAQGESSGDGTAEQERAEEAPDAAQYEAAAAGGAGPGPEGQARPSGSGSSNGEQQQGGSDAEQSDAAEVHSPDPAHLEIAASGSGPPDPAHLSSSYSAPWAAQHVPAPASSNGAGAPPRPHSSQQRQDEDGWQLVTDQAAARKLQGAALLAGAVQHPPYCRDREGFRNILMTAMMSIPWPLPSEYPPDCRYSTLLQISVGQEDIDEVISRDIHRTFPEYPLFGFEQGQQALFNVLKAYALHDMEAAYCQGMAFVAGLLLFYVPEEPAFQLFCRLLSTSGPNLRRLYLPGLEGLKVELRKLDWLMERFLPALTAHLNAAGVVPVLFASQWLLTCFSCPFPVGFACRLIDVMLQENSDAILLKAALTILAECEGDLLMQEDFEELLTYLKVEPVQWPAARLRRVLNAAIASPITAQDLADAEAALEQGFTGSLSRVPTFTEEGEAMIPEGEEGEAAGGEAAAAGGGSGAATPPRPRHSRNVSIASQAAAAAGGEGGGGGGGDGDEDAVAAELAAAQAQQEEELMNMVLMLDMDWGTGDAAEENYSNTLHSAVQGSSPAKPPA